MTYDHFWRQQLAAEFERDLRSLQQPDPADEHQAQRIARSMRRLRTELAKRAELARNSNVIPFRGPR